MNQGCHFYGIFGLLRSLFYLLEYIAMALCIECKQKLRKGALKCLNCGSFQDWRRYIKISTLLFSLLLLVGTIITTWRPLTNPPRGEKPVPKENISIEMDKIIDRQYVVILVKNETDNRIFLSGGKLVISSYEDGEKVDDEYDLGWIDKDYLIIEAKSVSVIKVFPIMREHDDDILCNWNGNSETKTS